MVWSWGGICKDMLVVAMGPGIGCLGVGLTVGCVGGNGRGSGSGAERSWPGIASSIASPLRHKIPPGVGPWGCCLGFPVDWAGSGRIDWGWLGCYCVIMRHVRADVRVDGSGWACEEGRGSRWIYDWELVLVRLPFDLGFDWDSSRPCGRVPRNIWVTRFHDFLNMLKIFYWLLIE